MWARLTQKSHRAAARGPWKSPREKGVFGHVAENAVPRSIFFLAWLTRDFAQNFRDARSGRDLATINRRAPWRPQRRRRKSLRSGIVPRQRRVLGIPRVDLHALAAPRPAQGCRRTDRSPQTNVAPYVWRTPAFLANGRNAVKPGLFCEPSGRVARKPCSLLVSCRPLAHKKTWLWTWLLG